LKRRIAAIAYLTNPLRACVLFIAITDGYGVEFDGEVW